MRTLIYPNFLGDRGALGLLVFRLVMGAAFILHGWPKIQNAFHWMDHMPDVPIPPPYLQALAALAEFGGGIGLILGLLTPLAALGIACNMVVAIAMVHVPQGHPFVRPHHRASVGGFAKNAYQEGDWIPCAAAVSGLL